MALWSWVRRGTIPRRGPHGQRGSQSAGVISPWRDWLAQQRLRTRSCSGDPNFTFAPKSGGSFRGCPIACAFTKETLNCSDGTLEDKDSEFFQIQNIRGEGLVLGDASMVSCSTLYICIVFPHGGFTLWPYSHYFQRQVTSTHPRARHWPWPRVLGCGGPIALSYSVTATPLGTNLRPPPIPTQRHPDSDKGHGWVLAESHKHHRLSSSISVQPR